MKIAIICSSFLPVIDGVTLAVFQRLKFLSQWGHQVIVLCPDYQPIEQIYPNYQDYVGEILPGIKVISLASAKSIALDFERDVTSKSYQTVIGALTSLKPDIIHVDEAERLGICFLKLPGVKYARQNNIPCVAWFHTNYVDYLDDYLQLPFGLNKLLKKILSLIFVRIYNAYDLTLVSSLVTAQKLEVMGIKNIFYGELLGYDSDQFTQQHTKKQLENDIQSSDFLTEKYGLPTLDHKIKLIFLGRLTPDKGWNFSLNSLANLSPEILGKIAIVIAGDGTLKNEIEHRLKQLIPDVYLLGRITPDAAPKLLTCGDIFITNSVKETRGLTVIEAAAASIPAIAPRAGGVIDTIEHGITGFLYQPQDEPDFLHKLERLIADPSLRQSMGTKAQERAQKWTWENTVKNLIFIWSRETDKKSIL